MFYTGNCSEELYLLKVGNVGLKVLSHNTHKKIELDWGIFGHTEMVYLEKRKD